MTVIILKNASDRTRGILKRWFIEPKPNIMIGTVNGRILNSITCYLNKADSGLSMMTICEDKNSQGFKIEMKGQTNYEPIKMSGHMLVRKTPQVEPDKDS